MTSVESVRVGVAGGEETWQPVGVLLPSPTFLLPRAVVCLVAARSRKVHG